MLVLNTRLAFPLRFVLPPCLSLMPPVIDLPGLAWSLHAPCMSLPGLCRAFPGLSCLPPPFSKCPVVVISSASCPFLCHSPFNSCLDLSDLVLVRAHVRALPCPLHVRFRCHCHDFVRPCPVMHVYNMPLACHVCISLSSRCGACHFVIVGSALFPVISLADS